MFVKFVPQGQFGNRNGACYANAVEAKQVYATLGHLELEIAGFFATCGLPLQAEFDCMMCFLWPLSEVPAAKAYGRLVRRDRVFEISGSTDARRFRAPGDVAAIAADVARESLGWLRERLIERKFVQVAGAVEAYLKGSA